MAMEEFHRQQIDTARLPQQVVEKWSANVLSEGFVPFPKRLVRSLHRIFPDVESMKELSALLSVVDYKRPNLTRPPSLAYLAFLAGLDEEEFTTALDRLVRKGHVQVAGDSDGMEITLNGFLVAIEKETQ
jgi:hypothetical protein